ncbi:hypothetical protein GcM3_124029, partial [Golovinomyces cichoracearum]
MLMSITSDADIKNGESMLIFGGVASALNNATSGLGTATLPHYLQKIYNEYVCACNFYRLMWARPPSRMGYM